MSPGSSSRCRHEIVLVGAGWGVLLVVEVVVGVLEELVLVVLVVAVLVAVVIGVVVVVR